jgi:hypothetical protein
LRSEAQFVDAVRSCSAHELGGLTQGEKPVVFQLYYNEHRRHAGRAGRPPAPRPDTACTGESSGLSVAAALSWVYHTPRTA